MIHFDSLYLISLIFKYEAFQTNSLDYLCLPLERRFSTFSIFFEFSRIIRSSDRIRSFDWIRKLDCHDQDFRRIDDLDNRPRAKITSITKTFLPLGSKTIRTIISKIYMYQIYISSYQPQLWRKWWRHQNDVTSQPTQKLRNPDQRMEFNLCKSKLSDR